MIIITCSGFLKDGSIFVGTQEPYIWLHVFYYGNLSIVALSRWHEG
jgi:hypothetical protein